MANSHSGSRDSRNAALVLAVVFVVAFAGYVFYESTSDSLVVVLNPDNETITAENYTGIPVTPTEYPGEVPYEEVAGNTLSITLKDPVRDTSSNTSIFRVDVRVVYPGQTSAEAQVYNIDLTLAGNVENTVHEIADVTFMIPEVFWGWNEVSDPASAGQTVKQTLLPGDILSNTLGERTYWIKPDFIPVNYDVVTDFTVSCGGTSGNTVEIRPIIDHKEYNNTRAADFVSQKSTDFAVNSPERVSKYVFGDGARLLGTVDVGGKVVFSSKTMPDGSLAKVYLYDGGRVTPYTGVKLSDATRFENISLTGFSNLDLSKDHGDGASAGIFACGHDLVMGMGVETVATDLIHVPQIFGGDVDYTKRGLNGSGFVLSTLNSDTHVVVNSGIYANVVGGSRGGEINGSTTVVVNGGVVLDTLVGGSSTFREPILDLPIIGSLYDPVVNPGKISGGTHVYINGGLFPGDYYEYSKYGNPGHQFIDLLKVLTESCIITGGSNDGSIGLDTEVIISGDADVWDVQGGGRRGGSTLEGTSNVTICGNAVVRHTASGSITEGIDSRSDSLSAVHHTNVTVCENARVYAVFGAGYDTFTQSLVPSVRSSDSTITVNISGGKVGYVYGGGYRGTVGSGENSMIESVEINITGGTVLNDVYGGGRGGLDRIFHDADGNLVPNGHGTGYSDPTGSSLVYARNITINITGGTVCGNVYGGGQSIPFKNIENSPMTAEVAAVYCERITIDIRGGSAEVLGSVFGVGNGIDPDTIGGVPQIRFYKDDGQPDFGIPWKNGLTAYDASEATLPYDRYAYVKAGTVAVNITGYQDRESAGSPDIGVYGGGNNASAEAGKVEISVNDSVLYGPVMGGGMFGTLTAGDAANPAPSSGVFIDIRGSTVNGTVFGGGFGSDAAGAGEKGYLEVNGTLGITVASGRLSPSAGAPALVGGGNYGNVAAGSVSITLSGTVADGAVMGGGILGTLTADALSMCFSDSDINGTVFGGGFGSTETGTGEKGSVAVSGTMGMTVAGSRLTPANGNPALIGGGNYGNVTAGTISITLDGTRTAGSVMGGGILGTTAADSLSVEALGSTVNGTVFGGGFGSRDAGSENKGAVTVTGTVRLSFDGTTVNPSADEPAAVGGGNYAPSSFGKSSVIITGNSKLSGDVFAGGIGYDTVSVDESGVSTKTYSDSAKGDREIVLAGSTVGGNVYGGSKVGTDFSDPQVKPLNDASIYLLSGKLQNVFGGGFQGTSYLNSFIYLGSAACEAMPAGLASEGCGELRLSSVYGGSNQKGNPQPEVLFRGNTTITVSETSPQSGRCDVTITGIISGQGNYSTVDPSSVRTVLIDGFDNTSKSPMMSIQLADVLEISNSDIYIRGSSKADRQEVTESVSVYSVDDFSMRGSTVLHIYSDTSGISRLGSYGGGRLMAEEDVMDSTRNEVRLYNGCVLNILGPDDDQTSGYVEGYSLLSRASGDIYYGAYALGHKDSTGGFMTDGGTKPANILKNDLGYDIITWYISGHSEKKKTVTLGKDTDTLPDITLNLFSVTGNTQTMYYRGCFVQPTSSGSLMAINPYHEGTDPDPVPERGSMFKVDMTVPGMAETIPVESHEFAGDAWNQKVIGAMELAENADSAVLSMQLLANTEPYSGLVGDLVLTFTEAMKTNVGSIPVNSVDYRISIYVEPRTHGEEVKLITSASAHESDTGYAATAYLMLPSLGSKHTYTLSTGVLNGQVADFRVFNDDLYKGNRGWFSTRYSDIPLNVAPEGVDGVNIGVAGIKPAAIRMELDLNAAEGDTVTLEGITITGTSDADPMQSVTYKVTVILKAEPVAHLQINYDSHSADGVLIDSPEDYRPRYLQVTGNGSPEDPFDMRWADSTSSPSVFRLPTNTVLDSTGFYFREAGGEPFESTVNNAVKRMVSKINTYEQLPAEEFPYQQNFLGFFQDRELNRSHSFTGEMGGDLSLYLGFGVTVSFRADGLQLQIPYIVLKLGDTLANNGLLNLSDEMADTGKTSPHICKEYGRLGYEMKKFDGKETWVYESKPGTAFSFDTPCDRSIRLMVPWNALEYTAELTFAGAATAVDGLTVMQTYPTSGEVPVSGGRTFTVQYGGTYVIDPGTWFSGSISASSPAMTLSTSSASAASFKVEYNPPAGNDPDPWPNDTSSIIRITVELVSSDGELSIKFSGKDPSRFCDDPSGLAVRVTGSGAPVDMVSPHAVYRVESRLVDGGFTLAVSVPAGTVFALWNDSGHITDRTASGTVSVSKEQCAGLTLCVYRSISVEVTKETTGGSTPLKFYSKTVPDNRQGYAVEGFDLDGVSIGFLAEGSPVYSGYKVQVNSNARSGNLEYPEGVPGTSMALSGKKAVYTLNGESQNVVIMLFKPKNSLSVTINFEVAGMTSQKDFLTVYAGLYPTGHDLTVTVGTATYTFGLQDLLGRYGADGSFSDPLKFAEFNPGDQVSCLMPGLASSPVAAAENSAVLTLVPSGDYTIVYNTGSGTPTSHAWNVSMILGPEPYVLGRDVPNLPAGILVNGTNTVWANDGPVLEGIFYGVPDPLMFPSDGTVHIRPLTGIEDVVVEPDNTSAVIILESSLRYGPYECTYENLFPGDSLHLVGPDGVEVTYLSGKLTIPYECRGIGTAVFRDADKGYTLELVVVADITDFDGGLSFIITLDKAGTLQGTAVQGS